MNAMLALCYVILIYASLGLCWFAWMWRVRTSREIAETERIRRSYGPAGIVYLMLLGVILWPVILLTAWRRR